MRFKDSSFITYKKQTITLFSLGGKTMLPQKTNYRSSNIFWLFLCLLMLAVLPGLSLELLFQSRLLKMMPVLPTIRLWVHFIPKLA